MNPFEYVNASTLQSAIDRLSIDGSVRLKAGGIDLLDALKERIIAPKQLVNIRRIKELNYIRKSADGSIQIGPLVTLSELATNELLIKHFPALVRAAAGAATPQIRNMATIGGNLCQRPRCWYFRSEEFNCLKKGGATCYAQQGDNRFHAIFANEQCAIVHPSATAVALLALGAKLKLRDSKGERVVDIDNFFILPQESLKSENILKYNEMITEIVLPAAAKETRNFYLKQKEKLSFDWPIADVAVALSLKADGIVRSARIVLGAAAPVPWRAIAAEKALVGKKIDEASAREAGHLALEGARPLTHNRYKLPLFETIVARTLLRAMRQDG